MMSRLRLLALLALGATGLTGGPAGLAAQVAGLPVRNAGIGTGIGIAADIGFPNAAAGKGFAVGGTGSAGFGPFGVSVSAARWDPKGNAEDAITAVGGTGNLKIFGGPLVPISVTLQGGVGRYHVNSIDFSQTVLRLPAGLGLALVIPNPIFSIKPWVAPRVEVTRTSTSDAFLGQSHSTNTRFGISGGVDLGFLSGLSIRAMYDRLFAGQGVRPSVLSLGLGFRVGK